MPITDNFDSGNSNGDLLSARTDWEELYQGGTSIAGRIDINTDGGGFNIRADQYPWDGGHATMMVTRTGTFPDDQYAELENDNNQNDLTAAVRCDSNGDGYAITCGGGLVRSVRIDAGAITTIASTFPSTAAGDTYRIDATGSTIDRIFNGSSEGTNTDSTHTSGAPGVAYNGSGTGNGGEADNFECTDESASGVTGTATLIYGYAATATGEGEILGTVSLAYGYAVDATGADAGTAGAFATIDGSGQALPTTAWADIDPGTIDVDADGILTEASGVFTPQAEGYYLVVAELKFEATHSNRLNIETKIQRNAADVAGAIGSDYSRDATNDLSWNRATMIAHFNGASDTFKIQHRRDTSTGTPAGSYSWTRVKVVQLSDGGTDSLPFAHYGTPTAGSYAGTGTVDSGDNVTGWDVITETDTTVIELQGDTESIRLKDTTRPYLVSYSLPTDAAGSSRTSRMAALYLDGTRIPHSVGHAYQRDSANQYAAPEGIGLVKPAAATDDLVVRCWLEEALQSTTWGTFAAYNWSLSAAAGRAGVMVIALPDTVDFAIFEDTTAGQTWSGSATLDLDFAETETEANAAFTRDSATAVTVPTATDVMAYAGYAIERTAASGTRSSQALRWELEGTDLTADTEMGQYLRGDQGSQDERNSGLGVAYIGSVSSGDTFNLEKFDPGTDDGANDVTAWGGSFFIDLATLLVSAGGGTTDVTGTASLVYGYTATASGESEILGTAALTYGYTATASGVVGVTGTATASYGYTAAATGENEILGTATLTYGYDLAATGTVDVLGTATATYGYTLAATGEGEVLGTAALAYGYQVDATGSSSGGVTGTATLVYGYAATSTGVIGVFGTAAAAYGYTAAASGEGEILGTATLAYGYSVTAVGSSEGTILGTASLSYGYSLAASGDSEILGTATLSYGYAATVTAEPGVTGTASLVYGYTVAATGDVASDITGTATLTYGYSVAASGQGDITGTATLTYGYAATATGVTGQTGTATMAYGYTVSAAGAPAELGTATLAYGYQVDVTVFGISTYVVAAAVANIIADAAVTAERSTQTFTTPDVIVAAAASSDTETEGFATSDRAMTGASF